MFKRRIFLLTVLLVPIFQDTHAATLSTVLNAARRPSIKMMIRQGKFHLKSRRHLSHQPETAPPETSTDVAIIGGGPAGASAALTVLRSSNLKVSVIDNNTHPLQIGEVVNSSIVNILSYLDLPHIFNDSTSSLASGVASTWGTGQLLERDTIFNAYGYSRHLDRVKFNTQLLQSVKKYERAKLFFPYRVSEFTRENDRFYFDLTNSENNFKERLSARFMIDCSGKRALFARKVGAIDHVIDRLIGVTRFYQYSPSKGKLPYSVLTEPAANGWWYSALLPADKFVVTFMCDAAHLQAERIFHLPIWEKRLKEAPFTHHRTSLCENADNRYKVSSAFSHYLNPAGGKGWVAAGDAACSFDPLSSSGIGHAMSSGIRAGIIARQQLVGTVDHTHVYSSDVKRNFERYMEQRSMFYQSENRWPNSLFWQARQKQAEKVEETPATRRKEK